MTAALILENKQISTDVYLMTVQSDKGGRPGQFYMLRQWNTAPLLSRPISIYHLEGDHIQFLYQIAGEGTKRFTTLRAGDEIGLEGPFGNGFPAPGGRVALVGGGIGMAPFYYLLSQHPDADVYLGFSREAYLVDPFKHFTSNVTVNVGGYITDSIDLHAYDQVLVCGPEPMMKAMQHKNAAGGFKHKVYVSLENRMACGIGACLVCSAQTSGGRKKSCKDGPVFPVEEVHFGD